jgi:hypothetical protein
VYCTSCKRWIDAHEEEAREMGVCADEEKCNNRCERPKEDEKYSIAGVR